MLVVNAGSSSLRVAVFDPALVQTFAASVTEIGPQARFSTGGGSILRPLADHQSALTVVVAAMKDHGIAVASLTAAAHRVVHGGAHLTQTCRITPQIEAAIEACVALAPLHNPANLTGIRALAAIAPGLRQYAAFDTAFHATNPDVATTYALSADHRACGVRRYGFHGINYAAIVRKVQEFDGYAQQSRLLVFHLGNGASACAIVDGASIATTMGYSPLDGLTMGTRAGGIDGNAVLRLARDHGIDGASRILNRESGLLGLGGASDMRILHAAGTPQARFAVEHFCYWAVRHAGGLAAAMGGLDAVVFTGGIGENDPVVRGRILQGLAYLGVVADASANARNASHLHDASSSVAIWTVPADEERQIALEASRVIAEEGRA